MSAKPALAHSQPPTTLAHSTQLSIPLAHSIQPSTPLAHSIRRHKLQHLTALDSRVNSSNVNYRYLTKQSGWHLSHHPIIQLECIHRIDSNTTSKMQLYQALSKINFNVLCKQHMWVWPKKLSYNLSQTNGKKRKTNCQTIEHLGVLTGLLYLTGK